MAYSGYKQMAVGSGFGFGSSTSGQAGRSKAQRAIAGHAIPVPVLVSTSSRTLDRSSDLLTWRRDDTALAALTSIREDAQSCVWEQAEALTHDEIQDMAALEAGNDYELSSLRAGLDRSFHDNFQPYAPESGQQNASHAVADRQHRRKGTWQWQSSRQFTQAPAASGLHTSSPHTVPVDQSSLQTNAAAPVSGRSRRASPGPISQQEQSGAGPNQLSEQPCDHVPGWQPVATHLCLPLGKLTAVLPDAAGQQQGSGLALALARRRSRSVSQGQLEEVESADTRKASSPPVTKRRGRPPGSGRTKAAQKAADANSEAGANGISQARPDARSSSQARPDASSSSQAQPAAVSAGRVRRGAAVARSAASLAEVAVRAPAITTAGPSRRRVRKQPVVTTAAQTEAALAKVGRGLSRGPGRPTVLTRQEENVLARQCQDLMGLQAAQRKLRAILHRAPTLDELSRALKIPRGDLTQRLTAGTAAKRTLLTRNTGLVVQAATRCYHNMIAGTNKSMSLRDMVEEGMSGLAVALGKFDPDSGYKLSTYAMPWIVQAMQRAVQNQASLFRLPAAVHEDISLLRRTQKQLKETLGKQPDTQQLATALQWSPKRTNITLKASMLDYQGGATLSMDSNEDGDEGSDLGSRIASSAAAAFDDEPGALSAGGLQTGSAQEELLLTQEAARLLSRVVEEYASSLPGSKLPQEARLAMFKQRMGLEPAEPRVMATVQSAGVEAANGQGSRQVPNEGSTLRAASASCGLSYESVRQMERNMRRAVKSRHTHELSELVKAFEQLDSGGLAPRATGGAHKKT